MAQPPLRRIDVAGTPASISEVLATLLPEGPSTTLVINGETSAEPAWAAGQVRAALRVAVEVLASRPGPVIVTGGTDAGIFRLLGEVVAAAGFSGPVIGVAPRGRIDRDPGTPLEPHHTHVLVVDAPDWGDETPAMISLCRLLAARGPVVAVIGGGGAQTRVEVAEHQRTGTPVILLGGSGRAADDLATAPDTAVARISLADLPTLAARLAGLLTTR